MKQNDGESELEDIIGNQMHILGLVNWGRQKVGAKYHKKQISYRKLKLKKLCLPHVFV